MNRTDVLQALKEEEMQLAQQLNGVKMAISILSQGVQKEIPKTTPSPAKDAIIVPGNGTNRKPNLVGPDRWAHARAEAFRILKSEHRDFTVLELASRLRKATGIHLKAATLRTYLEEGVKNKTVRVSQPQQGTTGRQPYQFRAV